MWIVGLLLFINCLGVSDGWVLYACCPHIANNVSINLVAFTSIRVFHIRTHSITQESSIIDG